MKIGFIGLGIMGKPMACNLLKAGYALTVNDINREAVEEVCRHGAHAATNTEIGKTCDVVLTMLPNSPQVKEVMLGENGVAYAMRAGSVYIDMSSINPMECRDIATALEKREIDMLDAPVSGGEPKAIDGTLSFMVGGKEASFASYQKLLKAMGASVVHCGAVGAGNTTKLANQIIVACNIQALAEALSLAQKADVDPQKVFAAIQGGLAGSTVMNAKAPMMLAGNAQPGFKIDLHIKDLNNALECAHKVGAVTPMTAQVMEVLQWLHHNECGQNDHSAIIKFYEALDGISLGR